MFVVGSTVAQAPPGQYTEEQVDVNPWTGQPGTIRYTKTCEPQQGAGRKKRQAQQPKEPNCYYHADEKITPAGCDGFCKDGNDGKDAHRRCRDLNGTTTEYSCTKKPVFVPLGKVSKLIIMTNTKPKYIFNCLYASSNFDLIYFSVRYL